MRSLTLAVAASVVLNVSFANAWLGGRDMLMSFPSADNAAFADIIVIGRVTELTRGKMRAIGKRLGHKRMADYRFVTVDVIEVLKGPKELTKLQVGVIDNMHLSPQPALFFLEQQEGRYFAPQDSHVAFDRPTIHEAMGYSYKPFPGGPRPYSQLLAETRAVIAHWGDKKIQISRDPQAALRSSSLDDRLYAVALLIERYRTPPPRTSAEDPAPAETEIDAAESRLILRTFAEADLDFYDAHRTERAWQASRLRTLFHSLNIAMDPARPIILGRSCYRDWLTENADTYRLKRFVRPNE